MIHVTDPRTGEEVKLFGTPELESELAAWAREVCAHPATELRRFLTRNGSEQVCEQCLSCGERTTSPQKHPDRSTLAFADPELLERYQAQRRNDRAAIHIRHIDLEKAREASFQKEYDTYMRSDAWRRRRELVLKRCAGTCEGCGVAPAVEVHHHHYRNFGEEFLFDLAGVCSACHERLHRPDG
jgi:hypothetical protein